MNNYQLNNESTISIYYVFRCDDVNAPSSMATDETHPLSMYDIVYALKQKLDTDGINYDLLIERFDSEHDDVLSNDYIVSNNYKNNI